MTQIPWCFCLDTAAAWGGMLIFDTVVFGMTLLKSLTLRSKKQDLISVLLRDGTLTIDLIYVLSSNHLLYVLSLGAIYFRCFSQGSPVTNLWLTPFRQCDSGSQLGQHPYTCGKSHLFYLIVWLSDGYPARRGKPDNIRLLVRPVIWSYFLKPYTRGVGTIPVNM